MKSGVRKSTVVDEIQEFFFEAMLHGWVSDNPKDKRFWHYWVRFPGYKVFRYPEDPWAKFHLIDAYCVNQQTGKSAGTTTILQYKEPVWWMNYAGQYEEKTIPFLKLVLGEQYQTGIFIGGRGPTYRREEMLVYRNVVGAYKYSFYDFDGREDIIEAVTDGEPIPIGYHKYWGMSLI